MGGFGEYANMANLFALDVNFMFGRRGLKTFLFLFGWATSGAKATKNYRNSSVLTLIDTSIIAPCTTANG